MTALSLGIARRLREPAGMDSLIAYRWSITSFENTTIYRSGVGLARPQAWLEALAAGRAALLSGELETLAVRVDGNLEALLDPGRDVAGVLDATAVTAELLHMYRSVTSDEVLERLVSGA